VACFAGCIVERRQFGVVMSVRAGLRAAFRQPVLRRGCRSAMIAGRASNGVIRACMEGIDLTRAPLTDPVAIYRYRDGMFAADLLTAAIAWLDFFTWLSEHPSDRATICAHFEIHERPADVMLTLFAAMDLVVSREGVFELTAVAREHLVSTSPWFIGPYYASLKDRRACRDFVEVLRTDRVAPWVGLEVPKDWHRAMEDAEFAGRFTAAMDCRGRYLGQALAGSLDLGAYAHVLDIAGGSGVYACTLVARHPHVRATVLEKPPVDAETRSTIVGRGFAGRVEVIAGDMFTDPWPTTADVHLLSNVLHDWSPADVGRLLTRSFEALRPGGLLVVHDAFINADKTGPLPVAEYSTLLMQLTQGKCYSSREYAEFASAAGFVDAEYRPTVADRGRMTVRRPG